jgi:Spy/CpxP family protein refolding chaperone
MKRQRVIRSLFLAGAPLVAAGALIAASFDAAARPGGGWGGGLDHGGLMRLESLTEEQMDKIADLHSAAEKEKIRLDAEISTLKVDLNALLREDAPSRARVQELARKIGELQGDLKAKRLMTHLDVKQVLTKEQIEELKAMRREHREMRRDHREVRREHRRMRLLDPGMRPGLERRHLRGDMGWETPDPADDFDDTDEL